MIKVFIVHMHALYYSYLAKKDDLAWLVVMNNDMAGNSAEPASIIFLCPCLAACLAPDQMYLSVFALADSQTAPAGLQIS